MPSAAVVTRLPPSRPARASRSLEERLIVRFPALYQVPSALIFGLLSPRSRLRRALLRRAALSGWAAWGRDDLDLMLVRFSPYCEWESPPEYIRAGMRDSYQGHAGARQQAADLRDSWEQMDITPEAIVDADDTFVLLGHVHIRARGSGVELDSRLGVAYRIERGLVVRHSPHFGWEEALHAAGIPEDVVPSGTAETVRDPGQLAE